MNPGSDLVGVAFRRARVLCLHCGRDSFVEWPATLLIRGDEKCGPCGKAVKIVPDGAEKVFHTSVREAHADGWIRCYRGIHKRIYGHKRGDHRFWRPFKEVKEAAKGGL